MVQDVVTDRLQCSWIVTCSMTVLDQGFVFDTVKNVTFVITLLSWYLLCVILRPLLCLFCDFYYCHLQCETDRVQICAQSFIHVLFDMISFIVASHLLCPHVIDIIFLWISLFGSQALQCSVGRRWPLLIFLIVTASDSWWLVIMDSALPAGFIHSKPSSPQWLQYNLRAVQYTDDCIVLNIKMSQNIIPFANREIPYSRSGVDRVMQLKVVWRQAITEWAWEGTKKMERSGTEERKGTFDEDRRRCIKEKEEKKGEGRLMETESGSLPFQFSLAVTLAGD